MSLFRYFHIKGNGIGRCLAFKLAKYGCTLILLDIDQKSNDEVRDLINENHGKAHSFKCDVTCKEEVYKLASKIEKEIGKVSILINNAGILHGKKLLDLSDSQIERIFNINIISQFWVNCNSSCTTVTKLSLEII